MCSAVQVSPTVAFIVTCRFWFLGGLARHIALGGLDSLLQLDDCILHFCQGGVLGGNVIGVLLHLSLQVNFGASDVSHFRPVLRCCLCEVHGSFLYSNQVDGSVANLEQA